MWRDRYILVFVLLCFGIIGSLTWDPLAKARKLVDDGNFVEAFDILERSVDACYTLDELRKVSPPQFSVHAGCEQNSFLFSYYRIRRNGDETFESLFLTGRCLNGLDRLEDAVAFLDAAAKVKRCGS